MISKALGPAGGMMLALERLSEPLCTMVSSAPTLLAKVVLIPLGTADVVDRSIRIFGNVDENAPPNWRSGRKAIFEILDRELLRAEAQEGG